MKVAVNASSVRSGSDVAQALTVGTPWLGRVLRVVMVFVLVAVLGVVVSGAPGARATAVAAVVVDPATVNLVANGSFETGEAGLSPWIFRHDVTATLTAVTGDAVDGARLAKVHVSATSSSAWLVQLRQENIRLHGGNTYMVSFWAKASAPRLINARLQSPLAPYPTFTAHDYTLTTTWQRFTLTYTAAREVTDAFVGFNLAQTAGDVEIDQVAVYGALATSLIQVTGTADETTVNGVCSLREAVLAANSDQAVDTCAAGSDIDEIVLPSGTYMLTIGGTGEQAGRTGDLDVTSRTTIIGDGSIIDAGGIDRAIEVLAGAEVSVAGVTIRNGYMQMTGLTGTESIGGGVYNEGKLSLTDSTVTGNIADYGEFGGASGAGIGSDGELTLLRTTVSGNTLGYTYPSGNGGGVFSRGVLTVIDSSITGNTAFDRGGGIYNGGTAVVEGSTVSGNGTGCYECEAAGGGIANDGDLRVTNSTISGNSANAGDYSGSGTGGGIETGGTAQLVNVTVADNSVGKNCGSHCFAEVSGAGISNSGSLSIANTIVSGDFIHVDTPDEFGGGSVTTPSDCTGAIASQGYNLIGVSAGCGMVASSGDLLDIDPLLGPLQDNGGPAATQTRDLGAGSPAIDAGNPATAGSGGNACPTIDQRGVTRPLDGNLDGIAACDIGAIETDIAHDTGDLLGNGSFDAGGGLLSPWIFRHDLAATAAVDTAEHVDGTGSARVTVAATSTATHLVQLRQEGIGLQAGAVYTVRFWAKASVPRVINARLQSPVAPYPTFKDWNFTLSTRWQRFQFSYTSPNDVANAFVGFNLAQATGTVWLDQVGLYNDSNLVTNGGFDNDNSTMAPWIWRNDVDAGLIRDTTVKFAGAASARITVPTVAPASWSVQLRVPMTTLEPGRTYRVSFAIKGSRTRLGNVRLQSSDAPYPTLAANNFNVTTAWARVSFQ